MRRLARYLEDRTGFASAVRALLEEPVPGGASFWHATGAVLVFLLGLEFATGVLLSFYYAPSAQTAWASVAFIQDELTLGWFVRGLHSFGSSALVLVSGLHFLQVVLSGAYRPPRDANWLVGLALFGLVLLFAITGYGLPWDQKGYWAKLVETSIMGTAPVLGRTIEKLAQGGSAYGNYTVTRFFTIHAFVLSTATAGLVAAHIALVRRHRVTPSSRLGTAEAITSAVPYWPRQAFRDVALSAAAFATVAGFVIAFGGADLEGPADPASAYQARPEWYARPLYQLRLLFEGPLEVIATMIIPGAVLGLLAALPMLDRAPTRDPRRRAPLLALIALGLVATAGLGLYSVRKDARDPGYAKHRAAVAEEASRARALARKGVLPEGGLAVFRNDPAFAARELFREECASCHSLTGQGGGEGPDLGDYNSRAWILAFLRDPQAARFMGAAKKPGKGMKPVEGTEEELRALTELVYAQTGAADVDAALVRRAESLFSEKNCDACHETDGTSEAKGPNLLARGTPEYVGRVIREAARPDLFGERSKMPRFAGKLAPEQIDALTTLVIGQRQGGKR